MLQRLKIENFIRIPYLDLGITRPVLLICGGNEAGKTTIAEAIRFVMFGDNPRIKYKKDFEQLVTNGAKRGSVELTFNNYSVRRNVKDGKPTGDSDAIPTDVDSASICLGVRRFVDLDEKERRGLIMRLMGVTLTPEKITAELKQRGFDDKLIGRYEPIYKHGIGAAFDKANRITQEGRGEWKGITQETYGPEKAEGWKPASPGIAVDELQASIAELDIDIAKLQAARDEALAPILAKIKEHTDVIDKQRGIPCPSCGSELLYAGGKLVPYVGASEQGKRMAEQLRFVQIKKRDEAAAKFNADLQRLSTDRTALQNQIRDDQDAKRKAARAAAVHEDIKGAEVLRGLFGDGPDGIMGRAVAQATGPFNALLSGVAEGIGWQTVTVGGDMNVVRADQVPYALLSESAQWRADLLLHVVIANLAKCPWLVFDRVDLLDPASRVQFIKWANLYGMEHPDNTLVALATLKEKPNTGSLEGIQTEWIEDGAIAPATLKEAVQ